VKSKCTGRFWTLYHALPAHVQARAKKSYDLWKGNHNHPSLRPEEILLVANVLIGGDKEIELVNSQRQQCAVLCSSPPSSLNAGAIVSAEEMAHGPRDSFVE